MGDYYNDKNEKRWNNLQNTAKEIKISFIKISLFFNDFIFGVISCILLFGFMVLGIYIGAINQTIPNINYLKIFEGSFIGSIGYVIVVLMSIVRLRKK